MEEKGVGCEGEEGVGERWKELDLNPPWGEFIGKL